MSAKKKPAPFSPDMDREQAVARAAEEPALLAEIIDALSGEDRRARQAAARAVHGLSIHAPGILKVHGSELTDALDRPEPQTRWEVLGALEKLVAVDARMIDKAIPGITTALHEPESGVVRLAAFRVLAAYGATTERRSERVWPLIDEAIRVYHGDPEFLSMLSGVFRLVNGGSSDDVKRAAAERMMFDAEHAKGLLGRRAKRIVGCAPKKRGRAKKKAE